MKLPIQLSKLLAAASLALFTVSSFAADSIADIKKSINETIAKVEEAVTTLDKGEDNKKIADLIVEARQLQKGISSSDSKISMQKSKSNHLLVQARTSLNDGDAKTGGDLLKQALTGYKDVKEKFDATH